MKELRENAEMTQKDVAEILKVDRSTYAGWETGKDTIPLRQLNKFCNYFNVSIDYVTGLSRVKECPVINLNIDLITVGNNLKKIREDKNLKQKDIFKLLNTTSSTYCAYEKGKVLISTSFVYTIATKYRYSIDWIIGRTSN